jgi:hypothetical protein
MAATPVSFWAFGRLVTLTVESHEFGEYLFLRTSDGWFQLKREANGWHAVGFTVEFVNPYPSE